MKKIALILILFASNPAFANNWCAGYITFSHISGYTYLISITTYTNTSSLIDLPVLDSVYFGDGDTGAFIRQYKNPEAPDISINFYQQEHTYPGPGDYFIHFESINRDSDIVNIPNSGNVPFYLESELVISAFSGFDNSPVITQPPVDFGSVDRLFVYNPGAYDPDGDSLSYVLVPCKGAGGQDIAGYTSPSDYTTAGGSFTLNPVTGDMIWEYSDTSGTFNVAFEMHEWRNLNGTRVEIGYVEVDMLIYIAGVPNYPPIIDSVPPLCVLAGDTAIFSVCAHDPDGDYVNLSAFGSTFTFSPDVSHFAQTSFNTDTVCGVYSWITSCARVRTLPYNINIKATEVNPPSDTSLVDIEQVSIAVVGPPPLNLTTAASGDSIIVAWQPSACSDSNVLGYKIYRRSGMYQGAIPCPCNNGVPAYAGYQFLTYVNGVNNNRYIDKAGLVAGDDYCYLVTAIYNTLDSTQSCASVQSCAIADSSVQGIIDFSFEQVGLSFSPNPATNELTIHTSSFHNEVVIISVMNVLGQAISSPITFQKSGDDATIYVGNLPSGMYFLQMKTESGSVVKMFVKE